MNLVAGKVIEQQNIGLAKKFIQSVNTLFNKVLRENEKCIFHFYLKLNELFGQASELVSNRCMYVCISQPLWMSLPQKHQLKYLLVPEEKISKGQRRTTPLNYSSLEGKGEDCLLKGDGGQKSMKREGKIYPGEMQIIVTC